MAPAGGIMVGMSRETREGARTHEDSLHARTFAETGDPEPAFVVAYGSVPCPH